MVGGSTKKRGKHEWMKNDDEKEREEGRRGLRG